MGRSGSKNIVAVVIRGSSPFKLPIFVGIALLCFHFLAPRPIKYKTYAFLRKSIPSLEEYKTTKSKKKYQRDERTYADSKKYRSPRYSARPSSSAKRQAVYQEPREINHQNFTKKETLYDRANSIRNQRNSMPARVSQKPILIKDLPFSQEDFKSCANPCNFNLRSKSGRNINSTFSKIKYRKLLSNNFNSINIRGVFMSNGTFEISEIIPVKTSLVERYKKRLNSRSKFNSNVKRSTRRIANSRDIEAPRRTQTEDDFGDSDQFEYEDSGQFEDSLDNSDGFEDIEPEENFQEDDQSFQNRLKNSVGN